MIHMNILRERNELEWEGQGYDDAFREQLYI